MTAPAGLKTVSGFLVKVPNPAFWSLAGARLRRIYACAFEVELAERRLALWLPVCAGAGAILHQCAAREPAVPVLAALDLLLLTAAVALRRHVAAFRILAAIAALFVGMTSSALRVARFTGPRSIASAS